MSISQELAIMNLMNTLDNFLASLKLNIDNLSTNSVIQTLNVLRCQNYGSNIDIFQNGIIFGLQACQVKQLGNTWGLSYGPIGPTYNLLEKDNMNDWVITRGNIFDGNEIINIEPIEGNAYVYKINPYITQQMKNFLVPGCVLYSTVTKSFRTTLSGQVDFNYPVIAVEKTGINKTDFMLRALDYKYFNSVFITDKLSEDIRVCRFILDINDVDDYYIQILNERELYPFVYGQPYYSFMFFANNIYEYIASGLQSGYDSNLLYNLFYYIINAEIWGTGTNAFYIYWTSEGRVLPFNVKYYYNILFDPDIS